MLLEVGFEVRDSRNERDCVGVEEEEGERNIGSASDGANLETCSEAEQVRVDSVRRRWGRLKAEFKIGGGGVCGKRGGLVLDVLG